MAESILKLRVDSQEYDNKIKRAAEGLQRYAEGCRKAGGTLTQLDEGVLEFTQALGNMNTSATSARGKVTEMTKAFTDLSMEYKQLTQEEKNAPFGKALAQSLDELKTRIQSTKQDLDDITQSLNGKTSSVGGGLFAGLGDKMSGALQVFAGNMLTKAAGAVANLGSEMVDMVQQGVELAKQGEGIRIAFERLGRGDILDGLREATHGTVTDLELMKAAVKFNDFKLPLDELGTMLAFAQQKAKDTGQSVDYMVDSIVTGLGRKSLMILDNLGLSANEVKEKMKETGDMTKAVGEIIREQMSKAGDYVETAADRATKADVELKNAMEDLGRTFQPLTDASNGLWNSIKVGALNALNTAVKPLIQALAEAGALGQGARSSAGFNNLGGNSKVDRMIGRLGNGKTAGAYSIYQQQLAEFDKYIKNKQFQVDAVGSDKSGVAQSIKTKLQTELDGALKMRAEYVRRAKELHDQVPSPFEPASTSGGGSGGKGSKSTSNLPSMGDFDKALGKSLLDTDKLKEGKEMLSPYQLMLPEIEKNILKIKDADLGGELAKLGDKKVADEIAAITTRMEQQQKATELAAQAAQNFGAALAGLDDPAMKAAGTVMQAIANIALSFSMAAVQASKLGSYGWIAYMAAGAGALATTISTIHSLTGYADGGMVKGNSYSGDNIFAGNAMVNAGELVLNKAQQATLAQNLQGEGRSINVQGILSGENILIATERTLKRKGRGELVTWK